MDPLMSGDRAPLDVTSDDDPVNRLLKADLAFIALRDRLEEIANILEVADQRCLAADGPVSRTKDELTDAEYRRIYKLAAKNRRRVPLNAKKERKR